MSDKKIRIAVIGGGMGGLSLAIGLMKLAHIDVQIYESAHKFSEIGAGVAVGPNAQRALEMIGPELEAAYLKNATQNQWPSHKMTWFDFRDGRPGPDEGKRVAAPKNEIGQSTTHRANFLDEFVKLIPVERAHFGKRLVDIEDRSAQGKGVVLHFKDGTTVEADAVIGADGVHSATRTYLMGADNPSLLPVYTGSVAYRGLIPMDKATEAIGAEFAQNSFIWFGYNGSVMTYPIDFGETMNVVAISYKFSEWTADEWVVPASLDEIKSAFPNCGEHIGKIISLLDHSSAWSMWEHPPAASYYKGHVCMMGDAAHASTPYQGQGAGQAIEDALVLKTLLGRVHDTAQLPSAFAAYDAVRRPRSQRNVVTSHRAGLMVCLRDPEYGDNVTRLGEAFSSRMDWLWHKDLEAQNREALELFGKA